MKKIHYIFILLFILICVSLSTYAYRIVYVQTFSEVGHSLICMQQILLRE